MKVCAGGHIRNVPRRRAGQTNRPSRAIYGGSHRCTKAPSSTTLTSPPAKAFARELEDGQAGRLGLRRARPRAPREAHGDRSSSCSSATSRDGRGRRARTTSTRSTSPPRCRLVRRVEGRFARTRDGARITLRPSREAAPDEYDERRPARRAAALRRRDGRRHARADRHGPEPAPARAARVVLRRRLAGRGQRWREAPAAKHYHQAYRHGLLEHCLSVAQGVSALSATFPGIDRDVAVTGALLHDIGKIEAYERSGGVDRDDRRRQAPGRDPARLLHGPPPDRGPAGLPARRPREAVLHIILSHHGKLEHGSPVVPCTREATLVHMIDNLGGTLGSFDRIEKSLGDGESLVGLRPRHLVVGVLRAARRQPPERRRSAAAELARAASRAPTPRAQSGNRPGANPRRLTNLRPAWQRTPRSSSVSCR